MKPYDSVELRISRNGSLEHRGSWHKSMLHHDRAKETISFHPPPLFHHLLFLLSDSLLAGRWWTGSHHYYKPGSPLRVLRISEVHVMTLSFNSARSQDDLEDRAAWTVPSSAIHDTLASLVPLKTGIPQGLPVSPILHVLYKADRQLAHRHHATAKPSRPFISMPRTGQENTVRSSRWQSTSSCGADKAIDDAASIGIDMYCLSFPWRHAP